jgi:tRNA threonylcarbamoyladenosine biosynthesis protein TsaE
MRTFTHEELPQLAREIVEQVRANKHAGVALQGNLGAGKTTLVQHIAAALGVSDTITSPTFVLMKTYQTADHTYPTLTHIDAYRMEGDRDAKTLGLAFVPDNAFLCIEWPELLGEEIPSNLLPLTLSYVDEARRGIMGV